MAALHAPCDFLPGHAAGRGIDVPRAYGPDEHDRLILDFIPGVVASTVAPLSLATIQRVGALVRTIHDASRRVTAGDRDWPVVLPAARPDLICHNDLATWNLVIDGNRMVFIDWDGAGPSTRAWDLAYAAISFAHLFPDGVVENCALRLGVFLDGYQASTPLRRVLPAVMVERSHAMYKLLKTSHESGVEPWASMYAAGHGSHWCGATEFILRHQKVWDRAVQL